MSQFNAAGGSVGHPLRRCRAGRSRSAGRSIVVVLSRTGHHVDREGRCGPVLSRDPAGARRQDAAESRRTVGIVQFDSQQSLCIVASGVGPHGSSTCFGQQLLLVVLDVLLEMLLHRGLIHKFLLALGVRTRVRTFARVRADVLVKYGLLPEAFSALWADVRLLSRVDPDVLIEYRLLTERLLNGITE